MWSPERLVSNRRGANNAFARLRFRFADPARFGLPGFPRPADARRLETESGRPVCLDFDPERAAAGDLLQPRVRDRDGERRLQVLAAIGVPGRAVPRNRRRAEDRIRVGLRLRLDRSGRERPGARIRGVHVGLGVEPGLLAEVPNGLEHGLLVARRRCVGRAEDRVIALTQFSLERVGDRSEELVHLVVVGLARAPVRLHEPDRGERVGEVAVDVRVHAQQQVADPRDVGRGGSVEGGPPRNRDRSARDGVVEGAEVVARRKPRPRG